MINILGLLFFYIAWLTLTIIHSIIGKIYTIETTNVILVIVAIIETLIAATFWLSAKKQEITAWRTIWLAGAILCIAYGWFSSPKIHENQLMKKAVATSIQMKGVKEAYPSPKTDAEKEWVWENTQKAMIADLRWEYFNKISSHKNSWLSIINFGVGFLCLFCVIFAKLIINKIKRST